MSSETAIHVENLGKCYHVYKRPQDRLKQFVAPRLSGLLGREQPRYFDEFWALRPVSFDIKRGETIGIVGRNGSGKSTLLQLICGTLTPTTGRVNTNGRISALLELGSGFNPEFTGRENVFLNGAIQGLSRESIEERFHKIAAFAEIGDFIDQPVKTYSSGMYARLAFSASIFVEPKVLIVDEILAVGDAPFQAKCMRAFHELRDQGCTILIVAHDAYMIKNFCQRAIYLRKGELAALGESGDVVNQYSVEVEKEVMASAGTVMDSPVEPELAKSQGPTLFRIDSVELLGGTGQPAKVVRTGEQVTIRFRYRSLSPARTKVTFVVNLYRHDGLYVFGTTSLMDGSAAVEASPMGEVSLTFPSLELLSGQYVWRVAVNDERGLGAYAEATPVCPFEVRDQLQAVGLVNMNRSWAF